MPPDLRKVTYWTQLIVGGLFVVFGIFNVISQFLSPTGYLDFRAFFGMIFSAFGSLLVFSGWLIRKENGWGIVLSYLPIILIAGLSVFFFLDALESDMLLFSTPYLLVSILLLGEIITLSFRHHRDHTHDNPLSPLKASVAFLVVCIGITSFAWLDSGVYAYRHTPVLLEWITHYLVISTTILLAACLIFSIYRMRFTKQFVVISMCLMILASVLTAIWSARFPESLVPDDIPVVVPELLLTFGLIGIYVFGFSRYMNLEENP